MAAFFIRRLAFAAMTTVAISIISFAAIQLPPGDYASTYVQQLLGGTFSGVSPEKLLLEQQIRTQLGLDRPVIVQYTKWAWRCAKLDFGISMNHGKKISEIIGELYLNTVILAVASILFTWVVAIDNPNIVSVKYSNYAAHPGGRVGVGGETTWKLVTKDKGNAKLTFSYQRPLEENTAPTRVVHFSISVR